MLSLSQLVLLKELGWPSCSGDVAFHVSMTEGLSSIGCEVAVADALSNPSCTMADLFANTKHIGRDLDWLGAPMCLTRLGIAVESGKPFAWDLPRSNITYTSFVDTYDPSRASTFDNAVGLMGCEEYRNITDNMLSSLLSERISDYQAPDCFGRRFHDH
jgi:hypothetical protein